MLQRQAPTQSEVILIPKLRIHFAEFLYRGSLGRLRVLPQPTCVGLRYGHFNFKTTDAFLERQGISRFGVIRLAVTSQACAPGIYLRHALHA